MTGGRDHLGDTELLDTLDGTPDPRAVRHLARCAPCSERRADLEAVRAFVTRAAEANADPPADLARRALSRIGARRDVSAGVNEVLLGFAGFARSLLLIIFRRRP